MSASTFKLWVLVVLMFGCAGCELVHVQGETKEPVKKTYPDALDLQQVELPTLWTSAEVPDSFNVYVNVVGIHVCPEGARCILPDGITVAASRDRDSEEHQLHLAVPQPRQFEVGERYLMSLEVFQRNVDDSTVSKSPGNFKLIGYSLIQRVKL